MADKITRDYVRSLTPRDRVYDVRDSECSGLVLRVHPTGRMVYVCEFARGRRINIARADVMPPAEARDKARQIIADFSRGIDPAAAKRADKVPTLGEFLDGQFKEWATSHYADGDATRLRLKAVFPDLLRVQLDEVTPWHVEKWRAARVKAGAKASTLNRQLNPLKKALGLAAEWGVIASNPIAGAAKLRKTDTGARVRYLSPEEDARLRAALRAREERIRRQRRSANRWRSARGYALLPRIARDEYADHLTPAVLLSLNTGIRRGELFNLFREDVDLERKVLTIVGEDALGEDRHTKSGQTRHVGLNREAHDVLELWLEQTDGAPRDYVFPGEDGGRLTNLRTAWDKVLDDAAITAFRWHDLRHTFASNLVMRGVDLNTVRELLGHQDLKTTLRYAHLAPHVTAAAVAVLDEPAAVTTTKRRRASS
jgi:integrase